MLRAIFYLIGICMTLISIDIISAILYIVIIETISYYIDLNSLNNYHGIIYTITLGIASLFIGFAIIEFKFRFNKKTWKISSL